MKILFMTLIAVALSAPAADLKSGPSGNGWHDTMRELSRTLTELVPDLVTPEVFLTDTERNSIFSRARKLSAMAHKVDEAKNSPSKDPQMKAVSTGLREQIDGSVELLRTGKWSNGTRQLLDVTRHCIACHSMKIGPSAASFKPDFSNLSKLQQADFYAATRQFDKAIINYEYALTDKDWAKANEAKWNEAFLKLLAITVRVRNNPSLTMELISRFFDSKTYPQSLKTTAWSWRQQAKEWRNEGPDKTGSLAKIRELVAKAEKAQTGTKEPTALVLYLRASAKAHLYLSAPENARDSEALYLAGAASEALKTVNFWEYPDRYYQACESLKAAKWSELCSERLKSISGGM